MYQPLQIPSLPRHLPSSPQRRTALSDRARSWLTPTFECKWRRGLPLEERRDVTSRTARRVPLLLSRRSVDPDSRFVFLRFPEIATR